MGITGATRRDGEEVMDEAFDPFMSNETLERILAQDLFAKMDPSTFPPSNSLRQIVRRHTRLRTFPKGVLVVRAGAYGNSAFYTLAGRLRIVLPPGLPDDILGRMTTRRKGVWELLRLLWQRHPQFPEVRQIRDDTDRVGTLSAMDDDGGIHIRLPSLEAALRDYKTIELEPHTLFGEIGALTRFPRNVSVFTEEDSELVDIRWQGLRDLRKFNEDFRQRLDTLFRERSIKAFIKDSYLFQHLSPEAQDGLEQWIGFETYGDLDWRAEHRRLSLSSPRQRIEAEPLIARERESADHLIMIVSGFARISQRLNHGHKTVGFLGRNRYFGLPEVIGTGKEGSRERYEFSLRALGYVHVLKVPTDIMRTLVVPGLPAHLRPAVGGAGPRKKKWFSLARPQGRDGLQEGLLEFFVEHRIINGTATMLIHLERCVRCDDCVAVCAKLHQGNPRFLRHGKRHGAIMVAMACMHCQDPVCMIGCPTGAIQRAPAGGQVVVNETLCIGCASCAQSCPYEAIRMVTVRHGDGTVIADATTGNQVQKATKCDLCLEYPSAPACQYSCPHDALYRADMRDTRGLRQWMARR
ncbi:MAG: cyclic nucleotide-binding domain-containing protein [Magnetococcales bacterium]|nr:cyclic nucleotide-binding domain-containing protein [Magnetococcales bacterium]MBF0148839.1 cyclic nucleotide-binding domain-containing protein [Magnetococcales bacterium]